MRSRSIVKAHPSITVFDTDTEEWQIEVSEPQQVKVFRFPDDSEQD